MTRSIVLIEARHLYARIGNRIYDACAEWRLTEDFEEVYDWCVIEAISRVLLSKTGKYYRVQNHIKHDFYRCVFDQLHYEIIENVNRTLESGGVIIKNNSLLKILVTTSEIIIVHRPF